ncbi:MAG: NAD-dependent dehydratase [Proteobacteria bacterium]|nr:MAG: NAD-dependent dehydratase [Pseudomonadota bacterium]
MKRVLILGANGQIARFAIELFLESTDVELTLFARNSKRLRDIAPGSGRVQLVDGDVLDVKKLGEVLPGHDVVYANLDGDLRSQAKNIITAMNNAGVKRLIFISSMGIYDEIPGQKYKAVLDPYRDSALAIEASNLDYTIIRPEWLNDDDEILYETTRKGQPFKNPEKYVSRKSVADLVVKCAIQEGYESRQSLGVNKP